MTKPNQHILGNDDALLFYEYSAKKDNEIEKRKNISAIASKHGIIIEFNKGNCTKRPTLRNKIIIYQCKSEHNKTFFRHIRNAFAHLYIEISDRRCILLDWTPYQNGKKQDFRVATITMIGDVEYDKFKNVLKEFFSQSSKKK